MGAGEGVGGWVGQGLLLSNNARRRPNLIQASGVDIH